MGFGGGGPDRHPCHRFCPPPPGVSAPLSGGSGSRADQAFSLSLVEGELLIRDAEEPYLLSRPTTITGQHDTGDGGSGTVTAGTFDSPPISFETVALGQPVFVDATFSQVNPASGTGSIDPDGNVSFRTALTVDLHIEVNNPPALVQECRSTPVQIALDSLAPYDVDTGRVTVRDANFSVPAVTVTDDCIDLVAENVNTLLAGGGHALTMTLEGDVELPPPAGCPTTTGLTVDAESSYLGDEVTLAATVVAAPDDSPECDEADGVVPAGSVEFRANGVVVAVADLDAAGHVQVVTDDLPSGNLALVARYRPQPPYSASSSVPGAHLVVPRPTIEADLPPGITIGAAPIEFEVTVANSGLGLDIANGRLDVTFAGQVAVNAVLERQDGDTWVPVPLSSASFRRYGPAMPLEGVALPAGDEVVQRFRISTLSSQNPTRAFVTFELVPVDPAGEPAAAVPEPAPDALARARIDTVVTQHPRRPVSLNVTPIPHTIRQGMAPKLQTSFSFQSGSPAPEGSFQVLLDGEPVPIRGPRSPVELGYQLSMPTRDATGVASPKFVLPPTTRTGTREVTVVYSGDPLYLPAQATSTITVLPRQGHTFECRASNLAISDLINMNVEVWANLPTVARPGEPIDLGQLDITMAGDRGDGVANYANFLPATLPVVLGDGSGDRVSALTIGFGDLGSATASSVSVSNRSMMSTATRPVDPNPDLRIGFEGESGQVTLAGDPGERVDVVLDAIAMTASVFGGVFLLDLACTPLGEPALLGSVTLAGTTLAVDAPSPTREGDVVTVRAQVAPPGVPGTVEILDGEDTLAVVTVGSDGRATYVTDELGAGSYSLRAKFRAGPAGTSSESEPVAFAVLPATDCEAFAEDGSGAVVRLVYMELLGRCPDRAGFDYWVGRLDGGTSAEVFARSIASTSEAVGRVVDDAYVTMLGRSADAAGREFWTGRLLAHGRYDTLLADLGASGEFWSKAGSTNTGFVTRVYGQLLGRVPDQAGQDYWVGRLDTGTSRRALIVSLSTLDEPLGVLVADAYDEILSRKATSSERGDGVAFLRWTGDRSGLYAQLIGRPEFSTRAQGFPNPED